MSALNPKLAIRWAMSSMAKWTVVLWLAPLLAFADEPPSTSIRVGSKFEAADTLSCGDEQSADAKECLANLSWKSERFSVRLDAADDGCGDFLIRFPSARPIGNEANDLVAMEWYAARDSKL